jgi:hypothetical protein
MSNPYIGSDAASDLAVSKQVSCLDRDGTFNFEKPPAPGSPREAWKKELGDRQYIVEENKNKRRVHMAVTKCTAGMLMRGMDLVRSYTKGKYHEPIPKLGFEPDGIHRKPTPPDDLDEFTHGIDWQVIGGVGSGLVVRHEDTYYPDLEFAQQLGMYNAERWSDSPWRQEALDLLMFMGQAHRRSPIDIVGNYENDLVDVACLPGRIELKFGTLSEKLEFVAQFESLRRNTVWGRFVNAIQLVDESNPPAKFQLYMLPKGGTKLGYINRAIGQLADAAGVALSDLEILFAGDAPPDLEMLLAVPEASATFILVGGSRLTQSFRTRTDFAGESLTWLYNALKPAKVKGMYDIQHSGSGRRTFIFGEEVCPHEKGPGTIRHCLQVGLV